VILSAALYSTVSTPQASRADVTFTSLSASVRTAAHALLKSVLDQELLEFNKPRRS
jgi:hypothetical protein